MYVCIFMCVCVCVYRASQAEKTDNTFDSQVVQYEPAHHGSINTVTTLSPDLCVSGGSDQVKPKIELLYWLLSLFKYYKCSSHKLNFIMVLSDFKS